MLKPATLTRAPCDHPSPAPSQAPPPQHPDETPVGRVCTGASIAQLAARPSVLSPQNVTAPAPGGPLTDGHQPGLLPLSGNSIGSPQTAIVALRGLSLKLVQGSLSSPQLELHPVGEVVVQAGFGGQGRTVSQGVVAERLTFARK